MTTKNACESLKRSDVNFKKKKNISKGIPQNEQISTLKKGEGLFLERNCSLISTLLILRRRFVIFSEE